MDYYFIDTVYDEKKNEIYYYVVHQKTNGNMVVVSRWFRTFESAEKLMQELNDDLFITYIRNER
jgi:hypothetical protein